jgi:hypothetical protein
MLPNAVFLINSGEKRNMTQHDLSIIQLTERYRIGTNAAYHRLVFEDQSLNAVSKITARMCRQGWLCRYPLLPPEDYFTPGPLAVKQFGIAARRTEPLGPQALPIDYAVLLFAMHGSRTRLSTQELNQQFPWLTSDLLYIPYCLTNQRILELIRVDLGGTPNHVARKIASEYAKRAEIPEFRSLVASNKFQVVVLTSTASKARLIRQAVEAMQWDSAVRLHMAMIPRLTLLQLRQA